MARNLNILSIDTVLNGIVLRYDMETINSGKMYDFSGNSSNASLVGTTFVNGILGGARQFNTNVNTDLLIETNPITTTGNFTVMCWVRVNSNVIGNTQMVLSTRQPSDFGFDMQLVNGTTIHGDIGTGTTWVTIAADTPFSYNANQWYHICYVVTPTTYTIYANGNNVGSGSFTSTTPLVTDTNHILQIGNSRSGFLFGAVDEVMVFSRALSSTEVSRIFNMTTPFSIYTSSTISGNIDVRGTPFVTMYAVWDSTVTAGAVSLQGSPDGVNWITLGTANFSAGNTNDVNINAQAHRYVRANITTPVTGGNVQAWIVASGFKEFTNDAGWSDPLNTGLTGSYRGAGIGFPTGSAFVSNEKLVTSWNMDTLTGSLMDDLSNNNNNGTIAGTTSVAGQYGLARSFLSATDNITGKTGLLNGATAITVAAWVFIRSAASTGQRDAIWNANGSAADAQGSLRLTCTAQGATPNGTDSLFTLNGSLVDVNLSFAFTVNTWYHVAHVWDGTKITVYINGSVIGTSAASGVLANTNTPAGVGGLSSTTALGSIVDEIQVFARALTSSEILALANRA